VSLDPKIKMLKPEYKETYLGIHIASPFLALISNEKEVLWMTKISLP